MIALVTGGAGFIGSHICDSLLKKGYRVRILDSLAEPVHPENRVPEYLPKDVELIIGDIRNKALLSKALDGVDVVFHEAAHQGYLQDYSAFFDVNSVGTAMIFEIIAEKKLTPKKIIIASSQAVYGEGQYYCPEHGRSQPAPRPVEHLMKGQWEHTCAICGEVLKNQQATEELINPNTQYAVSKYSQELIGLNLGLRHKIPVVCLRYSITLGRRQSFYNLYSGILRSFSTQMKLGRSPVIFEDGLLQRDYIHVDDVVEANMCVLENKEADYKVFNVGTGESTTVLDFYGELARIMNSSLKPELTGEFRVGDVRHIVSSPARLQSLGWKPKRNIRDMMQDYLQYLNTQRIIGDPFKTAITDLKNNSAILRSDSGLVKISR